nr:hypothetical protein [Sphingomonas sp. Ant20]
MPARIPMTERQRAALLALPDTETMVGDIMASTQKTWPRSVSHALQRPG